MFAFWYFRHCCYYCCCRCCCMLENIMNEHSVWARVPRALLGKLPHTHIHTLPQRTHKMLAASKHIMPLVWVRARVCVCVWGATWKCTKYGTRKTLAKKESIKKMNALCSCAVFDFEHTLSHTHRVRDVLYYCARRIVTLRTSPHGSICILLDVRALGHTNKISKFK